MREGAWPDEPQHIASAKMLLSHWSPSKLNNLLEETDIEMSRALDYVSPNNIKLSCVQLALHNELPAKECLDLIISNVNSAVRDGSQLIVFPEYIGCCRCSAPPRCSTCATSSPRI